MNTLDRLIIKAKRKGGTQMLTAALVYPLESEPGKWIARGDIWNGKPGGGITQVTYTCASIDEALEELEKLSGRYPNSEDVPIIINDLKAGD